MLTACDSGTVLLSHLEFEYGIKCTWSENEYWDVHKNAHPLFYTLVTKEREDIKMSIIDF